MKIHKYELNHKQAGQSINMPANAEIFKAAMRGATLCIWAMFNEQESQVRERHISILETGKVYENRQRRFIDTVNTGGFSLHIFEIISHNLVTNGNIAESNYQHH